MLTGVRLAAIGLTALLHRVCPEARVFQAVVFSIALGHFVIGYAYSRKQLRSVAQSKAGIAVLLGLAMVGVGLFAAKVEIIWYFALHHALNEAFIGEREAASGPWLRGTRFAFHLLWYVAAARAFIPAFIAPPHVLAVALPVALGSVGAVYLGLVVRSSPRSWKTVDNVALELVAIVLLVVTWQRPFSPVHIAAYHFAFWALFPGAKMVAQGSFAPLLRYSIATVVVTGAFVLVSPLGPPLLAMSRRGYADLFALQSHVHITLSFLLSRTNPAWLVALFMPLYQRTARSFDGVDPSVAAKHVVVR